MLTPFCITLLWEQKKKKRGEKKKSEYLLASIILAASLFQILFAFIIMIWNELATYIKHTPYFFLKKKNNPATST